MKSVKYYKSQVYDKWKPTQKIMFWLTIIFGILGLIGGSYIINIYTSNNQIEINNSSLDKSPVCVGDNCTQNIYYDEKQSKESKEQAYTFKITNAADDIFYEGKDTTELAGTQRSIVSYTFIVDVHPTKTPADYDTTCCLYWDTTEIGCSSLYNNWVTKFEADDWHSGENITAKCFNLGNSGSDTVRYDLVLKYY
jgi:hypothetical protein